MPKKPPQNKPILPLMIEAMFHHAVAFERVASTLAVNVTRLMVEDAAMRARTKIGSGEVESTIKESMEGDFLTAVIPYNVNKAFCIEIYLKTLVAVESGQRAWGHNLLDLFKAVSPKSRQKICDHHRLIMAMQDPGAGLHRAHAADFEAILTRESSGFETWRYHYDEKNDLTWINFSNAALYLPIRLVILELKPEWKKYTAGLEC